MKEEIIAYLKSPRNYNEGVALYEKYGPNKMLKAQFRKIGETELIRKTLYEELRKIAGISEVQFKLLKQSAYVPQTVVSEVKAEKKKYTDDILLGIADKFGVTVEELVSDDFRDKVLAADENIQTLEEQELDIDELNELKEHISDQLETARNKYYQLPEEIKKTISFRETFPFLKEPDCPEEFKILVADMFRAYDNYREAHEKLVNMPDNADFTEAYEEARKIVENYLNNRDMWEELEHYKENHEILGKADCMKAIVDQKEIKAMSDLDLSRQLSNVKSNISKAKTSLKIANSDEDISKATSSLEKWESRKILFEAELVTRK